jgi:hypothetical protein
MTSFAERVGVPFLPPLFKITMSENDAGQRLSIEFERFATNAELSWFIAEFQNHRFIMTQCSIEAERKLPDEIVKALRVQMPDGSIADMPELPKKFRVKVEITFYPQIIHAAHIPDFVRLFAGLDEGALPLLPDPPKPMSVWERLRAPLL